MRLLESSTGLSGNGIFEEANPKPVPPPPRPRLNPLEEAKAKRIAWEEKWTARWKELPDSEKADIWAKLCKDWPWWCKLDGNPEDPKWFKSVLNELARREANEAEV